MTDTSDAAALRALVGGRSAPPDLRTLKAVHRGLILLPTEPIPWAAEAAADDALAVRRSAS